MANRRAKGALAGVVGMVAIGLGTARAEAAEEPTEEQIGTVEEAATTQGTACRASCAVSYTALCLRVQEICAVGTVVTLGTAAIPCSQALAVTCLASAGIAVVCADRCPP